MRRTVYETLAMCNMGFCFGGAVGEALTLGSLTWIGIWCGLGAGSMLMYQWAKKL